MEDNYRISITEVLDIINNSGEEIKSKIPSKVYDFLEKNKKMGYDVNINYYDDNWENSISQDAQDILGMIYRDYLVTPEERESLILKEKEEYEKKYDLDNIFKNNAKSQIIEKEEMFDKSNENVEIVETKENLFKKIINKLKNFFHK